jgi:hypothetical protein
MPERNRFFTQVSEIELSQMINGFILNGESIQDSP